jgi:hypothetical protein
MGIFQGMTRAKSTYMRISQEMTGAKLTVWKYFRDDWSQANRYGNISGNAWNKVPRRPSASSQLPAQQGSYPSLPRLRLLLQVPIACPIKRLSHPQKFHFNLSLLSVFHFTLCLSSVFLFVPPLFSRKFSSWPSCQCSISIPSLSILSFLQYVTFLFPLLSVCFLIYSMSPCLPSPCSSFHFNMLYCTRSSPYFKAASLPRMYCKYTGPVFSRASPLNPRDLWFFLPISEGVCKVTSTMGRTVVKISITSYRFLLTCTCGIAVKCE